MMTRLLPCLAFSMLISSPALAALETSRLFGDQMVLQRDQPIPVFGKATAGAEVTVTLEGRSASTKTDATGKWLVRLPAMAAGGPYNLEIKSGEEKLAYKNVLVGEVWLCSGQSNMELWVRDAGNSKEEIAAANNPQIRLIEVPQRPEDNPVEVPKTSPWRPVTPQNVTFFSATGYYFGRELQKELKVPVGLINASVGATIIETWMPLELFQGKPEYAEILERRAKLITDRPTFTKLQLANGAARNGAGFMYNGMIKPVAPYGVRGIIWYQGESNSKRAQQYTGLFPQLIQAWRKDWEAPELPFYFVQLAGFESRGLQPRDHAWAELREAQAKTLSVPHTGMAVAIDIGDEKNIHPLNKQEVGRRLALVALQNTYGKPAESSGPMYEGMKIEGTSIRLSFKHAEGLKTVDGTAPKSFAVAGDDKKFYWAQAAEVKDGSVVLTAPAEVPKPVAVRYAWDGLPEVNLVNGAGLPAGPFRTDTWPGITDGVK